VPPQRQAATLNELELQKMEDDLVAARDRQQASVAPVRAAPARPAPARTTARRPPPAQAPAQSAAPRPTPAAIPVSSSQSIY